VLLLTRIPDQSLLKQRFTPLIALRILLGMLFVFPVAVHAQDSQAKDQSPLRVVITGLVHGHVHGFMHQFQHRPDLQIVGVAEPDHQLSAAFAKRYGLDSAIMFADLDEALKKTHPQAVLAYTNTKDHRRVVEVAAHNGVAVMMEKPLAVSSEDARAIQKAATDAHIVVLVNYETTWYRSNRAAYDLVHDNSIGEIRKVVVHDGHRGPKEIGVEPEFLDWLTDPERNGAGALFDFGCYGANLMTWLMDGQRPLTVTAVTQRFKPEIYSRVDDEANIVLTYPKAVAILQASWNWPFDRKDMEVYGQTGYAITVKRDALRVRLPGQEEKAVDAKPLLPPQDDPINYLRAVILGGLKPSGLSSLETNVIVVEILDAARLSASTGKTVILAGRN
jgi:glucose-fructose oxidoreductase